MEKKKVSLLPLLPPPPPYSVSSSLWLTYKIGMGRWWWLHSCSRQRQVKISAVRTHLGQFGHRTSTRRSSVPANPLKSSWWWSACWSAAPHSGDSPGTPTTTKTLYSPRTCSAWPTPQQLSVWGHRSGRHDVDSQCCLILYNTTFPASPQGPVKLSCISNAL